ncbi:sugar kinase [Salmonella enterica subsp. enterica]|uniref:Sugar kinase n=1 Tax=Salmonella enterica I TaxID=59201 RepID=A0A447P723_SALET|nr:sugar kinase [Salmonella enterica subsp. enterica]
MNITIATLGELLVEFLAKKENQGFSSPGGILGAVSQWGARHICRSGC